MNLRLVVWPLQIEKVFVYSYNTMHMIHIAIPTYEYDFTDDFHI